MFVSVHFWYLVLLTSGLFSYGWNYTYTFVYLNVQTKKISWSPLAYYTHVLIWIIQSCRIRKKSSISTWITTNSISHNLWTSKCSTTMSVSECHPQEISASDNTKKGRPKTYVMQWNPYLKECDRLLCYPDQWCLYFLECLFLKGDFVWCVPINKCIVWDQFSVHGWMLYGNEH